MLKAKDAVVGEGQESLFSPQRMEQKCMRQKHMEKVSQKHMFWICMFEPIERATVLLKKFELEGQN